MFFLVSLPNRWLRLTRKCGITTKIEAHPSRLILRLLLSDFPYSVTLLTCLSLFGDTYPGGLFNVHISPARILGHLVSSGTGKFRSCSSEYHRKFAQGVWGSSRGMDRSGNPIPGRVLDSRKTPYSSRRVGRGT